MKGRLGEGVAGRRGGRAVCERVEAEFGGGVRGALKFFWYKELIFFFQLVAVVKFETEPAGVLKIGFVDDEGGVLDLR